MTKNYWYHWGTRNSVWLWVGITRKPNIIHPEGSPSDSRKKNKKKDKKVWW
jgi:hypothetical protein